VATPQLRKQFHALCHEHHIPMRMIEVRVKTEGLLAWTSAYACPESDCAVRYTVSQGYFIAVNGHVELDATPRVRCTRDRQPMYLVETGTQKRAFRLWRCPQYDSTRTNEEDLVNQVS
jgi:hypothetical protein